MTTVQVNTQKVTPKINNNSTIKDLVQAIGQEYAGDNDIITFSNHKNELIEAVEVSSLDTIYLVKISSKLQYTMINFDQDSNEIIEPANIDENEVVPNDDLDD